ncbi:hypothetical protein SRHO_G00001950 [Serrasalmus rhombeus]
MARVGRFWRISLDLMENCVRIEPFCHGLYKALTSQQPEKAGSQRSVAITAQMSGCPRLQHCFGLARLWPWGGETTKTGKNRLQAHFYFILFHTGGAHLRQRGAVLRPPPDKAPATTRSFSSACVVQLQALPVGDRLDLMTRLSQQREGRPESDPGSVDANANPVVPLDRTALWRALLFRKPPASFEDPMSVFRLPHTSRPVAGASTEKGEGPNQAGLRSRRHAFIRGHHPPRHGQLMRVGCVLGTCQVQNLSHRLYQLVGQTGREDSSPVNPRSPHSYG